MVTMVSVTCPYCGEEFDDEIDAAQEGEQYKVECLNCEKTFGYSICITVDTSSYVLPCGLKSEYTEVKQ